MVVQNRKTVKPAAQKNPKIWIAVALAAVALIVMFAQMQHAMSPPTPNLSMMLGQDKHPFPDWVKSDAATCKGDISKLDPQEQQKLSQLYPGSAGIVMHAAYTLQSQ